MSRLRRVLLLVAFAVLAPAACATVTAGHGSALPQTASPSASASASASATVPATPTPTPSGRPSTASPSSTARPTVAGWRVVETRNHIAYDVPPAWHVNTPDTIVGWENDAGIVLTLHNSSDLDSGYCPNDNYAGNRGLTGVQTAGADLAGDVRTVLGLASKIFADDDGSHVPHITTDTVTRTQHGAHVAVGSAQVTGIHVHSSCGAPAAFLYVVAIAPPGQPPVVFVATIDKGIAGSDVDATVLRMAMTVRPV